MPKNHVRIKRLESGLTQAELAERMPDGVTNMCVSYIEAGKVLPTKDGLKALCTQLLCAPTDLYRLEDLDLLSSHVLAESESITVRIKAKSDSSGKRQHGDMVEFRTWLKPSEKEQLEKAIAVLGYRSMAEWFRESYRELLARAKRFGTAESQAPEQSNHLKLL